MTEKTIVNLKYELEDYENNKRKDQLLKLTYKEIRQHKEQQILRQARGQIKTRGLDRILL